MSNLYMGFALRLVQILALSAPTILIGLFVAGVFERLVGYENLKRVFGQKGLRSLVLAWLLGMLLPVCSLGVLPVLRVMRRAGLSGGTLLAFALSAPLFNPLSLLYGMTLSRPLVITIFAGCSLIIVTGIGQFWDHVFAGTESVEDSPPQLPPGWRRMAGMLLSAVRIFSGPTLAYVCLGLLASACLAAVLPHGALSTSVNGDNPWAPLNMLVPAVFCYSTPQQVMGQIGAMFTHANSVGAALILLALGTGLNCGTMIWMLAEYGWKRSLAFMLALVMIVLSLAYAVDSPLHPYEIEPANHTHAFDVYTNPFPAGTEANLSYFLSQLKDVCTPIDRYVFVVMAGVLLISLLFNWIDPLQKSEQWLTAPTNTPRSWDLALPPTGVAAALLLGLIILSVAGCYVFYPPPEEVFDEIAAVKAEAIYNAKALDDDEADFWIETLDEWTRRLEVGAFIRGYRMTAFQRMKGQVLRTKLEQLQHAVEYGDKDVVQRLTLELHLAHNRLKAAILPGR